MKRQPRNIEEQATGCLGAGDYRKWAASQGYPNCAVLDWISSAGDWTFIVSKDGNEWYVMEQTNAYPRPGFLRSIDLGTPYHGTEEQILKLFALIPLV
jgi:hypothetical protein